MTGATDAFYFRNQAEACQWQVDNANRSAGVATCTPIPGKPIVTAPIVYSMLGSEGTCRILSTSACQPEYESRHPYTSRFVPCPAVIELKGPSATKALPAGPALQQSARVTQGGVPAQRKLVRVRMGAAEISGLTNAEGLFHFLYVPPLATATSDQITATCTECSNAAQKQITVEACDACAGSN
ncbi:MAG TPA: hypothetical protein VEA35_02390 [Ramlibacter sp.]|nr:hypothetical protein [Ramlibacter sp.]